MSIPDVTLSYSGTGPTATGEVLAGQGSGASSKNIPFYGTATLDGSLTSFKCNYIDGTKTIASPAAIIIGTQGGGTATVYPTKVVDHTSSSLSDYFTLTISGAGSNAQTFYVAGYLVYA